jgi:hypothetical protein
VILLIVFVGAVVIGLLRGGHLSRIVLLPLRWPGLSLLALAAQLLVIYFPESQRQGLFSVRAALLIASYVVLLLMLWLNRHILGATLVGLGLLLNLAVMLANGGYMPITPQAMQQIGHPNVASYAPGSRVPVSKDIALPKEQTRLWVLSDVLVLPPPFPVPSAFSVGDVLIGVGAFLVVQTALLGPPPTGVRGARYRRPFLSRTRAGARLPHSGLSDEGNCCP